MSPTAAPTLAPSFAPAVNGQRGRYIRSDIAEEFGVIFWLGSAHRTIYLVTWGISLFFGGDLVKMRQG